MNYKLYKTEPDIDFFHQTPNFEFPREMSLILFSRVTCKDSDIDALKLKRFKNHDFERQNKVEIFTNSKFFI